LLGGWRIFFLKKKQTKAKLPESLKEIKAELIKKSKQQSGSEIGEKNLSDEDKRLVDRIRKQTNFHNRNNITRTKAYLDFYKNYPEIHWAFLGHMVSRNGGWNMTDLKGEFLPKLLASKERSSFFSFLERGNWLIFQDVYPQFLLYEETLKQRKNMFYLLPVFGVSTFMETIWKEFLQVRDCYMLTIALVINEQSYLEKRVVQNPHYQKEVLATLEFQLQEFFSFTHILFPYLNFQRARLVGLPLRQFASLPERIRLGKRLYALIFHNKSRWEKMLGWANRTPHTGSRQDYWPDVFHHVKEGVPKKTIQRRLHTCKIKKGAARVYSPMLPYAWKDVHHEPAEQGDWFSDWRIIDFLVKDDEEINGEIEHEYCQTLEKIELAAIAKKAFSFRENIE
jgi:hypothetical protein